MYGLPDPFHGFMKWIRILSNAVDLGGSTTLLKSFCLGVHGGGLAGEERAGRARADHHPADGVVLRRDGK